MTMLQQSFLDKNDSRACELSVTVTTRKWQTKFTMKRGGDNKTLLLGEELWAGDASWERESQFSLMICDLFML